ncbi:MAG: hypothetical protein DCF23_14340 [Cyanobium sp.]|nr:MAG: hypothetical protein DCF23_14340 [Cyanobium sp.]
MLLLGFGWLNKISIARAETSSSIKTVASLLAQGTPLTKAKAIPAELQRWFDTSQEAARKGNATEAVRLMQQVLRWVQGNLPKVDLFHAQSLINYGVILGIAGQRQEALAQTEEAVSILRKLPISSPAILNYLADALNNLGIQFSNLGRQQ